MDHIHNFLIRTEPLVKKKGLECTCINCFHIPHTYPVPSQVIHEFVTADIATVDIADFANTKSMGKCITHDWNPLKVLNLDSSRQGANCYDINIESQTPLKI